MALIDSGSLPQKFASTPTTLRVLLYIFSGAIGFSLGGILLIQVAPNIMVFFGKYFIVLVKVPTWTYMAMLPLVAWAMYQPEVGTGRMAAVATWGLMVGGGSELLGTTTGFPFGEYGYTDWLGPKLLDHVPYFIPLSWFAMSIVSFDLGARIARTPITRVLAASVVMTLWDVSLDPAMSRAFPFWSYGADGFFYGMPLSNWGGWFLVSLVINIGIEVIVRGDVRHALAAPFYFLNCFFPFMLSFLYGLYGAGAVGMLATFLVLALVRKFDHVTTS